MSVRMDPEADMRDTAPILPRTSEAPPVVEFIPHHPRTVIVLMVAFKFDIGLNRSDIMAITRRLHGYRFKAAMHSKRQCAWVVQTELTADKLMERVRPAAEAGSVENAWSFTPGADVASLLPLDPLQDHVAKAWREVRRFNQRFSRQGRYRSEIFEKMTVEGKCTTTVPILDTHPLGRVANG